MRLLFAGTPETAVPSLQALLDSSHDVVTVLTRPDAPTGRGRQLKPSPVASLARALDLRTLTPDSPADPTFLTDLPRLGVDCCAVVAYGGLIPAQALAVPRHGWVNLHFSLLPAYRGAAPVQHAVLSGEEITGACTFALEEGLDTGPVYGAVTERIRPEDTSGDVLQRLARSGADLLVATMDGIEAGTLRPQPQPSDGISHAPKLTVDDVRIDWTAPGSRVDRLVRAATPAPGAWTTFRGDRLKVLPVRPESPPADAPGPQPGRLPPGRLEVHPDGVRVGTATAPVLLTMVQPAGKRVMDAVAWSRGVRPTPDEALV